MSSSRVTRRRDTGSRRVLLTFAIGAIVCGLSLNLLKTPNHDPFVPVSDKTALLQADERSGLPAFTRPAKLAQAKALGSQLPLAFEDNQGQTDSRVKFFSRGNGYNLFLTSDEAVLDLRNLHSRSRQDRNGQSSTENPRVTSRNSKFTTLRLKLENANPNPTTKGTELLPGRENYFIGNNPKGWQIDVPTYARVVYENIYPGVALTYYGNQRQLEYDFEIAPGSDPQRIRIACLGAEKVSLNDDGDLVLLVNGGELRQRKPVAYQYVGGTRTVIDSRFIIKSNSQIGFEVGGYDKSRPLVIDPTLIYSTYLGGAGDDSGSSIDVDAAGNIYVAGTTTSTTFPTVNAFRSSNAGLADAFVTKLDPTGSTILYSTYIGGSGLDRADGIFVDRTSGAVFVAGRVDSSSTDFPTTTGAFATTYRGGDFDAFVLKLSPQGNSLAYSTFLGGGDNDSAIGVAADVSGNTYVTGGTRSSGFPTTATAFQFSVAGDTDAYLVKLNPTGSALLYSTLLGGGATDRGSGVKVDNAGNAYIVGYTSSQDFPTEGAFQNLPGGSFDAFVARLDTTASGAASLVFCTYLGGTADDKGYGLALDSSNNIYVAGQTTSIDFPVLNPAQAARGGNFDAFVAKISQAGAKLGATYIGGSGDDRATGIAANSAGNAYVTGYTASTNFPVTTPLQASNGGGTDAFVAKLNLAGDGFVYSTYLGGSANEDFTSTITFSGSIAVDASNNAYITGYTASTNFPTLSPEQAANAGGATDAFIAKISDSTPAADFTISASPASQTVNPGNATSYNLTVTPVSGFTGNVALSVNGVPANTTASFNPASVNITGANAGSSVLTITTSASTPAGTHALTVTGTSGNLQHSTAPSLIVAGATSANLSVSKTASPNPAIVSSNLTYRIIVTNTGPSPATNVAVTDPLPAGVNFVSATPTQGTCSGTTTVTCNLGTLASGSAATVSIICVPQSTGQLSNTVTTSATESDPNLSDNSATITTPVTTQSSGPSMLDPNLSVRTVVSGLSQPTSMAFIGPNDFFILEKDTGKVKRIVSGAVQGTVLDLAVNSASERGLLGIALHPRFTSKGYVYLYWTESSTGVDSTNLQDVALLGNRVDRYVWDGSTLIFDRNLIKLHAFQADANQPLRGNHNGGVLRFGPDGKLFVMMGDNGRRGFLQNVTSGAPVPDDQFGGPEPDNAHLTGFILRLNDDGSTPSDNPFFNASTNLTGEAAANIKKLFAYGVRNGFGLAFDPLSGNLWDQENGDDAFDEMNRVTAGSNNGWIQIMGPVSRIDQYKQIETTYGTGDLQQLRWSPSLIADTPADALSRLYMLPGAHYNDPEFSWKYAVPAAALGFVQGRGIGPQFEGDMFVGAARTFLDGGFLFRFKLTPDRLHFSFADSRLTDLVADNLDKFDVTESESLLIGKDFGIVTDIGTGPNGNLFVVSNTNSAVYEISGNQPTVFIANLNGAQEVPPNSSTATGTATLLLSPDGASARLSLNFNGLTSPETVAHIHGPAGPGNIGPVLFPVPQGSLSDVLLTLGPSDVLNLRNGQLYIDIHSNAFTPGEIRGQFQTSTAASSVQFNAATFRASESSGAVNVQVTRMGDTSGVATVDYQTLDDPADVRCDVLNATAYARCDYATKRDTLTFAPGETSKTFSIPLVDDGYAEGSETFMVALSSATGASLGAPTTATVTITDNETVNGTNPISTTPFFVRQHYLDFLSREPEAGEPWTAVLNNCSDVNNNPACDRLTVSAAFLGSQEFQLKGYFVFRFYKLAFNRLPFYSEIVGDMSTVTGQTPQDVYNRKAAFSTAFAQRQEFINAYASLSNAQYVATLMGRYSLTQITTPDPAAPDGTTKVTLTSTDLTNRLNGIGATLTRAQVLRAIADSDQVLNAEFNQAFVAMQYYGYLRRTPEPSGYNAWLSYLNAHPTDSRTMVNGFMNSVEYRLRFGAP